MQVPEHDFVHLVLVEQRREEGLFLFDVEGRVVDERDERVPFLAHLLHFLKGEAEALGFAQVERLIVIGKVGTAGTRPAARARHDDAAQLHAVVLQEVKAVVGARIAHAGDARPPVVVIAADEHLFTGEIGKRGDVVHALLELHAPGGVAAEEDDVLLGHPFPPVGFDFIQMPFPALAEDVHRLLDKPGEVQIADRKHFHGKKYSIFLRAWQPIRTGPPAIQSAAHTGKAGGMRQEPTEIADTLYELIRRLMHSCATEI